MQASYLRLLDWRSVHWHNRAQFFATAARMMRHALVDAARARQRVKRGRGVDVVSLEDDAVPAGEVRVDLYRRS